ncbi:TPA: hypothetical protein DEP90_03280 [Patescibacteria group bacterium]|nr:hypothetical protein [Patescibacteria group bacterium]
MPLNEELIQETLNLARHLSSTCDDCELTMIQLRTVLFVAKHGVVKSVDIAKEFLITSATVTPQIDNLTQNGWLKRTFNKNDRRVIDISLTKRAKQDLPLQVKKVVEANKWIFDILSKKEKKLFLSTLKKVHKNAHTLPHDTIKG